MLIKNVNKKIQSAKYSLQIILVQTTPSRLFICLIIFSHIKKFLWEMLMYVCSMRPKGKKREMSKIATLHSQQQRLYPQRKAAALFTPHNPVLLNSSSKRRKNPGPHPRRKRSKLLHFVTQFSQLIIAALFVPHFSQSLTYNPIVRD